MKQAYLQLIKHAINDKGFTVSVFDTEEWAVKRSTSYKAIKEAIEAVGMAELVFRDAEGERTGWAHIVLMGNAPDETVSDFTANEWMESWFDREVMAF